jgi:hypothetical protein
MLLFALLLTASKNDIDVNFPFPAITRVPQQITLLLPLQGEYKTISEAIQAGFMTANEAANKPLTVNTIDTKRYRTIQTSYRRAIQQGTDVVIGPLLKADVQALARSPTLQLPVLTLNYLDKQREVPANFYQFGLSPLDEVAQITQQAKAQKHASALILVPDNAWGAELAQAFTRDWKNLGGIVTGCLYYSPKLPALGRQIRRFLKFSPPQQRRTDFDMIFLGANSEVSRQIKPLLAFYFASNVPIYTTASSYDQSIPAHLNRDLDNMIICDTPWSVEMTHIRPDISSRCIDRNPKFSHYARYYALGADAFLLAMQLVQLDQNETETIKGASGDLSLDKNRYVVRKPVCAQFNHGIPQPL